MTKPRTPTSYLDDEWGMTPPGGTNASGAEETPLSDRNNPYRVPMGESPDWGLSKEGMTSYGHSDDVKVTQGAKGGLDKSEIAQGFSRPKVGKSPEPWQQDLPQRNEWDRGAGSDVRSREFFRGGQGLRRPGPRHQHAG